MDYKIAYDLQDRAYQIIDRLGMDHIDKDRIACVRSRGSSARGVVARVHGLPVPVQLGMCCKAFYVIEFLERFEKCSEREKIETIIHELLHIPKNFGGGFRHHNYVENRKVRELYERYINGRPRRAAPTL